MATKIVTKNSSTASAVPTASDLVQGELAVNVADKRLFTEDNGGAIVEVGTNPSTLTVTGEITANGGIALGDNDKATFGAGDDLEIYHDGSNSIIKDGGTGNLNILAGQLRIKNPTDAESLIEADVNGAVRLYHDNAAKLATTSTGIDVTGTATMDGLTVGDGHTLGDDDFDNLLIESSSGEGIRLVDNHATNSLAVESNVGFVSKTLLGTNRFFVDHATGDISFYEDTGSTPKLFWDASAESLGIGTSSPSSFAGDCTLALNDSGGARLGLNGSSRFFYIGCDSGSDRLEIGRRISSNTTDSPDVVLDGSGNLLVGATSNAIGDTGFKFNSTGFARSERSGTGAQGHITFTNGNGDVGSITTSGSSTSYNTSSDYRLKTDAQPMTGATARLKALKPVNFEWIADGTRVDGFLAHEAQEVVPECVSGEKDAMQEQEYEVTPAVLDEEGNTVEEAVMGVRSVPDYQGIDQSKLVPLLVATIQELEARITELENN